MISKSLTSRTESAVKNRIKSLINKIKQDLNTMDDLNIGINRVIAKKKALILKNENKESASPKSGLENNHFMQSLSLTFSQTAFKGNDE